VQQRGYHGEKATGIVVGVRVPLMPTNRANGKLARMASCVLAQLFVRHKSWSLA
jgi:phosphate acetyltransferase